MKPLSVVYGCFFTCFGVYTLDRISKNLVFQDSALAPSRSFIWGVITHIHHRNLGIAFDIPLPSWLILSLSIIALGLISYGIFRALKRRSILEGILLGALLGGSLGNFMDRFTLGYVRDWILLFNRSVINLADIFILIGLVGYLWTQYTEIHKEEAKIGEKLLGHEV